MEPTEVLKIWNYKAGYQVRTEIHDGSAYGCSDTMMRVAYSTDGAYIGDSVSAYRKAKRFGIQQWEKSADDHNVCSIGFSPRDQKWYGWSHRAIYGFGIGSDCKKGDCGYIPEDGEDYLDEMIAWWTDEYCEKIWGEHGTHQQEYYDYIEVPCSKKGMGAYAPDPESKTLGEIEHGVWVHSLYNDKVPNEKLRGTTKSNFSPYPDFGKGDQ